MTLADLRCSRCGHPRRVHAAPSSQGGEADACGACVSCEHFLPAYPLRRVVSSRRLFADQRTGPARTVVRKHSGWNLTLDCGHTTQSWRRLVTARCIRCVKEMAS